MKQILNKVTVTGADDTIHPSAIQSIATAYPFAEFGILMSRESTQKSSRFPSNEWLSEIETTPQLKLSAHLCGQLVREFLQHGALPSRVCNSALYRRIQINTHAILHKIDYPSVAQAMVGMPETQFIFQYDGVNNEIVHHLSADFGLKNCAGLFDLSHGAGTVPTEWPKPLDGISCGYAGGLSHSNIGFHLAEIETKTDDTWIDAETRLRSRLGFDADLVCKFLDAAKPWVNGGQRGQL